MTSMARRVGYAIEYAISRRLKAPIHLPTSTYEAIARDVLAEITVPSPEMIEAGERIIWKMSSAQLLMFNAATIKNLWQTMSGEALK